MGYDAELLAASDVGVAPIDPATLSPFCQLIAGDITGFNDGDTINTPWPDSSGNGHTFNPTGGVTFQTNEFNGEDVVRFNGSGGFFTSSEAASTWNFLHNADGHTVFVVFKIREENPGNNQFLLDNLGLTSSGVGYSLIYRDTGPSPFIDGLMVLIGKGSAGNPVIDLRLEDAITTQAVQIVTESYEEGIVGDDENIFVNGSAIGSQETQNAPVSSNPAFTLLLGRYVLGGGLDLDGDVAEYCFFNKLITPKEISGISAFYIDKYIGP
jgi:hypothetical protein